MIKKSEKIFFNITVDEKTVAGSKIDYKVPKIFTKLIEIYKLN